MNHNYQKHIELMICLFGEKRKGNKGGDENPSLPLFGWTKVSRGMLEKLFIPRLYCISPYEYNRKNE